MGHTSFQFNRRSLLQAGLVAAGGIALTPGYFKRAFAAGPITVGPGPYGPLQPFDANGIALPAGFQSREIARGLSLVPGTLYPWHQATDGQATFATLSGGQPDGGWILVANSEMPIPLAGGVSGVEFAPNGDIERAYRVLAGTTSNCAGGRTPWGRWLSCEEYDQGMVHECDPTTTNIGVARPELGVFAHEAVSVDPIREQLYLTEDEGDGCLYRFTPDDYPDLSSGLLEVAQVDALSKVTWAPVPDPGGGLLNPTRTQVAGAAHFRGGEGTWYDEGIVYFTTKGDQRVWALDVVAQKLEILYDEAAVGPSAPLSGVDNITVSPSGDIFVCEDGADHDICMITPDYEISRFLKLHPDIHAGPADPSPFADNETVGVVFSPDGTRMYFGAQRSFPVAGIDAIPAGVVYEITGPFRQTRGAKGAKARVKVKRRRHISKYLRRGLPIKLGLDDPAGVKATLTVKGIGKDGRKRRRTIGRAASSVALQGDAALKVEPTKSAKKWLRGRKHAEASVRVEITDAPGRTTVTRHPVTLFRKPRERKRD